MKSQESGKEKKRERLFIDNYMENPKHTTYRKHIINKLA